MAIKTYKPTTPSRRQMSGILYRGVLSKNGPEKSLVVGFKRHVGRNADGRITVRHKGGGHKRLWRVVDFKLDKKDMAAKIKSLEYDPNRTAFIALVVYQDGEKRYMVVPEGVKEGDRLIASSTAEIAPGNRMPLGRIPVGTQVYNIELKPNTGARMVRSAGSAAIILAHDEGLTQIKLPSREVRKINSLAWASVGQVSNFGHNLVVLGKAGRSRWKGVRPTVRGSAMNPVDHPYGGGEGRQGAGMARTRNLWGKGTRGVKTRRPKKYSNLFIISRRQSKSK